MSLKGITMKAKGGLLVFFVLFLVFNSELSLFSFTSQYASASRSPMPVYVKHNALITDTPSVWVFAEVINNSTKIVSNVTVRITFYDKDGKVIDTKIKETSLRYILPHRRAPVFASISGDVARNFSRYEVTIESYQIEQNEIEKGIRINVEAALLHKNGTIQCTVYNNSTKLITDLSVYAIFYDQNGIRCAEGFAGRFPADNPLKPGGESQPILITSLFVNSSLEKVICILTAEARATDNPEKPPKYYYEVDREVLIWLKGEKTIIHQAVVDGKIFYIVTYTNSSIYDLVFSKTQRKITFKVDGIVPESMGFCNVTIPIDLLKAPYIVKIDGEVILDNYRPPTNGTHNFVYLVYNHGSKTRVIEIISVGEFDYRVVVVIMIGAVVVIFVLVLWRKRPQKTRTRKKRITRLKNSKARIANRQTFIFISPNFK